MLNSRQGVTWPITFASLRRRRRKDFKITMRKIFLGATYQISDSFFKFLVSSVFEKVKECSQIFFLFTKKAEASHSQHSHRMKEKKSFFSRSPFGGLMLFNVSPEHEKFTTRKMFQIRYETTSKSEDQKKQKKT